MLKKRLIFVLYIDSGNFFLSRNFRLQRVGDAKWLVDKFRFKTIGRFIDEIVILDVNRDPNAKRCEGDVFEEALQYLMKETFVPLTIGGGLKTVEDVQRCLFLGADKVLFNSAVIENPGLVKKCVSLFGAQAVVGAVDVVKTGDSYMTKINNAQNQGLPLGEHLKKLSELGVGEVLLNSVERDGTGVGFDLKIVESCPSLEMPLILCGGAGKPEHFSESLSLPSVEAVATGHLFNFMGKGFESARIHLTEGGFAVRSI